MSSTSTYEGERDYNNLYAGQGKLVNHRTGIVYEGAFRDGAFEGEGALTLPNGARYRARWAAGVEVPGSGSYQWADGLPYNCPVPSPTAAEAAPPVAADMTQWPFLTPFDRRTWPEHRAGVRADVSYEVHSAKSQLSSTAIALGSVSAEQLRTTVVGKSVGKAPATVAP